MNTPRHDLTKSAGPQEQVARQGSSCRRCNDGTHFDFPTGREACNGCDRTPAWCRCQPVKAAFVPEWKRRASSKDLTGAAA